MSLVLFDFVFVGVSVFFGFSNVFFLHAWLCVIECAFLFVCFFVCERIYVCQFACVCFCTFVCFCVHLLCLSYLFVCA